MAQFKLNWINTTILSNPNSSGQKALYRQKAVGGAWLETGFSPANPLATYVAEVTSPVLSDNKIWEFKLQCTCTEGGPVDNDNGVQEKLKFVCVNPTLEKTLDTATITLSLAGTDVTKVRFTLRKVSDNSIVFGPYFGNRVADVATALASGLTAGTQYYWQAVLYSTVGGVEINSAQADQLGNVCGPYLITTEAPLAQDLRWVADQTSCEKEGGFGLERTITGLSTPNRTWYDSQNSRVYVTDNDNSVNGNVYWFNPDTATSSADMIYSSVIKDNEIYNTYIDGPKRKIYFVGRNTGGLLVYDIDSNTSSVVAFGTNTQFSRITLTVSDNYIYCNDATNSIVIIDRNTLTISSTKPIAGITNSAHFNTDVQLVIGNGKLYAINANNTTIGTIGVYSLDLNTHHGEITLPGATAWSGGFNNIWQSGFFDSVSGNLYVGDIGSSSRYVIDTDTDTVIDTKVMNNKSGKSNVRSSWTTNPVTGELLYLYGALNNSADSAITRTYLVDRDTHAILRMYENQSYSNLTHITGTTRLVGAYGGGVQWNGTPGWDTDGTIQILNTAIAGGNTGNLLTLTLKEVDYNNANTPTGQVKDNIPGNTDYVAPTASGSCAITYTLDCPVDQVVTSLGDKVEWEFSLASAVKNNPEIAKIQVFVYNVDTSATVGVPIEYNSPYDYHYFSGEFTGLAAGPTYTIRIKYLNASGVELKTC